MPKFLFRASLTAEGLEGVMAEGAVVRRQVVTRAIESLGGTVEAYYFAFGDEDAVMIADLPGNEAATAFAVKAAASGVLAISTTVLLTPEEVDRAVGLQTDWHAPGSK